MEMLPLHPGSGSDSSGSPRRGHHRGEGGSYSVGSSHVGSYGGGMLQRCTNDDVLLSIAGELLDLFSPRAASALSCTCKRWHGLLHPELAELRALWEGARRLASDAGGLVTVLTVGIGALRHVDEVYRSPGFGGYCFKARDAVLVAKLCRRGAFVAAPHGMLLNMSMGHLGATGAAALADAIAFGMRLREMCLDDAHVTDGGCVALADALRRKREHLTVLESLSLRRNGIGDNGAAAVARMLVGVGLGAAADGRDAAPPRLQSVRLAKNPIGFDGIAALTAAADAVARSRALAPNTHADKAQQATGSTGEAAVPPRGLVLEIVVEIDPPIVKVGRPERPRPHAKPAARSAAAHASESGRRQAQGGGGGGGDGSNRAGSKRSPSSASSVPPAPPGMPPAFETSAAASAAMGSTLAPSAAASALVPRPPDWIATILGVRVRHDGAMTAAEAARLLKLSGERKPKWLLAQVHPDKQPPHRRLEAAAAAARVTQAIDVRRRLGSC